MRSLALIVAWILLAPSPLSAQNAIAGGDSAAACTYDSCALRLEGQRVLRGVSGQPVLSLGMWGASRLAPVVARSDSAARYAAEFDRNYTTGVRWVTLGLLGSAVVGAVIGLRGDLTGDPSDRELVAYLVGLGFSLSVFTYGDRRHERALRALSRAIWWTNRDLPR